MRTINFLAVVRVRCRRFADKYTELLLISVVCCTTINYEHLPVQEIIALHVFLVFFFFFFVGTLIILLLCASRTGRTGSVFTFTGCAFSRNELESDDAFRGQSLNEHCRRP